MERLPTGSIRQMMTGIDGDAGRSTEEPPPEDARLRGMQVKDRRLERLDDPQEFAPSVKVACGS
ncbi:MAG: hypothetical protein NVS3B21_03450 [Acidimicrobiales bacterium]